MNDRGYIDRSKGIRASAAQPDSLDTLISHLEKVEAWWNAAFKEFGLPFHFSAQNYIGLCKMFPEMVRGEQGIRDFLVYQDKDGIAWANQIRTSVSILKKILENPGKSGICTGPTQSGKTGISHNCQWLAPAVYMATGTRLQILSLLPNKKGIEEQSQDESRKYNALYRKCSISYKDESWTLETYWHDVLGVHDPDLGYDPVNATHIRRRCKGSVLSQIKETCAKARDAGHTIMFHMDEIQWGAETGGLQSQIMDISSELAQLGGGDFLVGFSATPWQVIQLENFWKVGSKLTSEYVGFNFLNGEPIDPDVECKQPNYMSVRDFAQRIDWPEFRNIHRSAYNKKSAFEKLRKKQEQGRLKDDRRFPATHGVYRRKVEQAIAVALNCCLVDQNLCQGKGAVVRLPIQNRDVETFKEGLIRAGLNSSIEVIIYTGEAVGQKIRRIIQRRAGAHENRPYLIIPTGAARMADNLPAEVKYFFDFSEESTLIALFQGLLGRACGFGKGHPVPWVILAAKPKKTVDRFVRTKGMPVSSPTNQVSLIGNGGFGTTRSLTLRRARMAQDPDLAELWREMQAIVDTIPFDSKRPRPRALKKGNWLPGFWSKYFSEGRLRKLETLAGVSDEVFLQPLHILRPGEVDEEGFGWARNGKLDNGKLGFRNAGSDGSENSNLPSDRFMPGGQTRSKNKFRMEVQVHVDKPLYKGGKWKLVAIRLRLGGETDYGSYQPKFLPNSRCAYNRFLSEKEKRALEGPNNAMGQKE